MTPRQKQALEFIASKPMGRTCGYDLKRNRLGNTQTLKQLAAKGMCEPVGLGHMAMPQTADYRITDKGREAIK